MTDRSELLDYADRLLDGEISLPSRESRTAALLARKAFEDWLDEHAATWCEATLFEPSTTSKLVVLGTHEGVDVGDRAKRVWHGLSRAVHHHAYELQPSHAEVRKLVS